VSGCFLLNFFFFRNKFLNAQDKRTQLKLDPNHHAFSNSLSTSLSVFFLLLLPFFLQFSLVAFLFFFPLRAEAAASSAFSEPKPPSWLLELSDKVLPQLPPETEAVYLLNEQSLTLKPDGLMTRSGRQAIKILRPDGIDKSRLLVRANTFNTKIRKMKGWVINSDGSKRGLDLKDAISTSLAPDTLYWDVKIMALILPEVTRNSLIGFEWEEEIQPISLEDNFPFQTQFPVLDARYLLKCSLDSEPLLIWINFKPVEPVKTLSNGEKSISLELKNIPAIKNEPLMPDREAIAGRLLVRLKPNRQPKWGEAFSSWKDIGLWYEKLSRERRHPDKTITDKALELTAGITDARHKLERLAEFVQKEVRYVSIQIGIGGYQPHPAASILANRYGDCKDKATLLAALLESAGFDSFYIIINVYRQVVTPDSPVSLFCFNHAILAIKLADSSLYEGSEAVINDPDLGPLLIFDPTTTHTPFGQLPFYLRGNTGLLVAGEASKLIKLPDSKVDNHHLLRQGKFSLQADGTLVGKVTETLSGFHSEELRRRLSDADENRRRKDLESFLARTLTSCYLEDYEYKNMDNLAKDLQLCYAFKANSYLKRAGNLLSFRPTIIALVEADELFQQKETRRYPLLFPSIFSGQDEFEIELPEGYLVDNLPVPVKINTDFADYACQFELAGNILRLKRQLSLKKDYLPAERFEEVASFFQTIYAEERRSLILKQKN